MKVATTKAQRKLFFNLRKHEGKNVVTNEEAEILSRDLGVEIRGHRNGGAPQCL